MCINENQWTLPLNILLFSRGGGKKALEYSSRDNRFAFMRQVK